MDDRLIEIKKAWHNRRAFLFMALITIFKQRLLRSVEGIDNKSADIKTLQR